MKINNLHAKRDIREMKSDRFGYGTASGLPPDLPAFHATLIWPRIELKVGRRHSDRKKKISQDILHNLLRTGVVDRTVADSRDPHRTPGMRTTVWDAYVAVGFAHLVTGSELSGMDSRYSASSLLLNIKEYWEQNLLRNTNADGPLVVLTTGDYDWRTGGDLDGEPPNHVLAITQDAVDIAWMQVREGVDRTVPFDWSKFRGSPLFDCTVERTGEILEIIRKAQAKLDQINRANARHVFTVRVERPDALGGEPYRTVAQVCTTLRQQHSRKLFRAVRLYTVGSPGQNMPREQRATMQIDGEPTVELDFKCLHLYMLYHTENHRPTDADLYRPEKIMPKFYATNPRPDQKAKVRNFIKVATQAALNAPDPAKADGKIIQLLKDDRELWQIVTGVEGLPGDSAQKRVRERLAEAHAPIAKHLFSGAGLWLMTADGELMLMILSLLTGGGWPLPWFKDGIPAFPIHDSIRVPKDCEGIARLVMTRSYQRMFKAEPRIEAK